MDKNNNNDESMQAQSNESLAASYNRFVPQETIALLGKDTIAGVQLGDHTEKTMTILFADIRDFSTLSEKMTPGETFLFINEYLTYMEPVITRHGGIIDKYMGDGIMALFPNDADAALHGAIEMLQALQRFNVDREKSAESPLRIGIGMNTGLMMLGIIGGQHRMESTVVSDAVNVAARIESMTKNYGVPLLISEHTYYGLDDASHHHTRFIDRVRVKGKTQPQSVFEVFDADPPELREAKQATMTMFGEALAHYHFKEIDRAQELLAECLRHVPGDTVAQVYYERCRRFNETGVHESTGEVDLKIAWDDSLLVGVAEIDAQHRELFKRVADFVAAVRNNRGISQVEDMMAFLDDYIVEHFTSEEKSMAKAEYPFLSHQQEQHRRFSRSFAAFKKESREYLDNHPTFLLFRTQVLVIDWLMHHVSKLDKHFGKFMRQQ